GVPADSTLFSRRYIIRCCRSERRLHRPELHCLAALDIGRVGPARAVEECATTGEYRGGQSVPGGSAGVGLLSFFSWGGFGPSHEGSPEDNRACCDSVHDLVLAPGARQMFSAAEPSVKDNDDSCVAPDRDLQYGRGRAIRPGHSCLDLQHVSSLTIQRPFL